MHKACGLKLKRLNHSMLETQLRLILIFKRQHEPEGGNSRKGGSNSEVTEYVDVSLSPVPERNTCCRRRWGFSTREKKL